MQQQPYEVQEVNNDEPVVVVVELLDQPVASFRPSFSFPVPQCVLVDEWQQHEDLGQYCSATVAEVALVPPYCRHRTVNGCGDNTPGVVLVVVMDAEPNGGMSVAQAGSVPLSADIANAAGDVDDEYAPYSFHGQYEENKWGNSDLGTNHFAAQVECGLAENDDDVGS